MPLERIAYVQFSDALPPAENSSAMAETLHRRTLPGDGTLDLRRFAHVLRERGWDGLVSVEVLSAALRERLPVGEFAAAAGAATARYWS
jgi:sugar phosphate isomerase/epimerase